MFRNFLLLLAVSCGLSAATAPKALLVIHAPGAVPEAVEKFEHQFGKDTFRIVVAGDSNGPAEIPGTSVLFLEHPNAAFLKTARPVAELAMKNGMIVVTDLPEMVQRGWNVAPSAPLNNRILPYWQFGGTENLTGMLMLLYQAAGGPANLKVPPAVEMPKMGVYHPRAKQLYPNIKDYLAWYRAANPKQGKLAIVTFFYTTLKNHETATVDALIAALEHQGFTAAGIFGWPYNTMGPVLETAPDDPIRINLSFTLALSHHEDAAAIERTGAHVINLMTTASSYEEWARTDRGVSSERVATSLASPERNGATEPIMVATQEADPKTGIYRIAPIAERVQTAALRAHRWLVLQEKSNREKKIAILYYNNPPGKGNLGASYLNLPPSITAVLGKLRNAGYNTGGQLPGPAEILADLERVGRNIETWAPGELEKMVEQGGLTLLPLETYRRWFNELPKPFRDSINARWGPPEAAKLMTITTRDGRKLFVIPGIRLGNIFVGPQLLRASAEEYANVQQSATLPPHHAYVASYLYYRHQFAADAIIHMGRHGTLERLPGKNAGQAGWDTSEVLLGDLPNVNYYIMDGGGEELQARRRSAAVLISHLTPMIASGGPQERFKPMQRAYDQWMSTRETSPELAERYGREALDEARKLHLDTQLSLFGELEKDMPEIDKFLQATEEGPIPMSLPVLGHLPSESDQREGFRKLMESGFTVADLKTLGERLCDWSNRIFDGQRPDVPDSLPAAVREKLSKAFDEGATWLANLRSSPAREAAALIDVLDGHFLPSGLSGDPLRTPAALPSGRNLHETDPSHYPTKEAWEVGKKMGDELISRYRRDHGNAFPERISMVLWAGETGRHQGVMEAEAFWLMGVAPEWNARGVVDRVSLIPDPDLGRPRVSVVFTASGLYRDAFSDKIRLLDRAARMAAAAGENAISRHNREIEAELIAAGMSREDAGYLAGSRVFAPAPGSYGTGLSSMVELSRDKDEAKAMADLYMGKTSYVYTEKVWGESKPHMLESHLRGNQAIVHSRSSNLYGIADNDDVYQAVGGLDVASKAAGASPDVLFNNLRAPGKEGVEDARHVLAAELNGRNWNPKWLTAMKESGYSGARLMANSVEYLYGWQATAPETIDPSVWKKTYDVYVADEHHLGLPEFLAKANPFAQQKLIARLLEIDRQGVWQFSSAERTRLLSDYVKSVSKLGVACSANVCGNRKLRDYVAQQSKAVGQQEISRADLSEFQRQFREATASAPAARPAAARQRPQAKSSWLKNVTFIDLHPRYSFAQRPFGIEWSVWLLSGVLGGLYPWARRRTRLWSSANLLSTTDREL